MAKLNINGTMRDVSAEADTPLLWVIREHVGLTGTKYGCGVAQCGACSVHVNGEVQRSCQIPVGDVKETDVIVTIEGLSVGASHPVQKAWAAVDVPAMRLLPVRPDHGRRGAAQEEPQADRQGHRRSDDQHLPVRHLSAHPRGRASGGRRRHHRSLGRLAMNKMVLNNMVAEKATKLSRRTLHRRLGSGRGRRSRARVERAVRRR